jgi:hypothetical protein
MKPMLNCPKLLPLSTRFETCIWSEESLVYNGYIVLRSGVLLVLFVCENSLASSKQDHEGYSELELYFDIKLVSFYGRCIPLMKDWKCGRSGHRTMHS